MKLIFDFFPLILFFGAYRFYDIYTATGIAIAASLVQVFIIWYRTRKFEPTHIVTLAVIVIFGGMTLIFRDDVFIRWKPTIVEWIFAAVVFGSNFVGRRTAIEYVMGSQLTLPNPIWKKLKVAWGLFFLVVGALNIYVAFFFRLNLPEEVRLDFWVNFKVFGMMGLTLVFVIGQMFFIAKHIKPNQVGED